MSHETNTKRVGRRPISGAAIVLVLAAGSAFAQGQPETGTLGVAPVTRAPTLDPKADAAPRSPAEIEAGALGPPVKTKTFRVGPDGKPK